MRPNNNSGSESTDSLPVLIYYNKTVQKLTSIGGRSENGSLWVYVDDIAEMMQVSGVNLTRHQTGRWHSTHRRVTTLSAGEHCHQPVSATIPAIIISALSSVSARLSKVKVKCAIHEECGWRAYFPSLCHESVCEQTEATALSPVLTRSVRERTLVY